MRDRVTGSSVDVSQIAGDWLTLQRRWEKVVGSESTLASRSGGWCVRKENSGEGLAPIAGEPDEVAVYLERGHRKIEVGRWTLEEVSA